MKRFRIIQIVINGLLVIFLAIMVISLVAENRWRFDRGLFADVALVLVSVGFLLALSGSIRLNFLLLRHSNFSISLPKKTFSQLGLLALSIAILYFAIQMGSSAIYYDSHLSTHYVTIELPHWLAPSRGEAWRYSTTTLQDNEILSLLFYHFAISLIVALNNTGLFAKTLSIRSNVISPLLLIGHFMLGVILLSLTVFLVFGIYTKVSSFVAQLDTDPGLMNLSNFTNLAFEFCNALLALFYAQWIIRDSSKLWGNVKKASLAGQPQAQPESQ